MTESPKSLFQQIHKEAAANMSVTAADRSLRLAVAFTLSQMAYDGATQEQLAGAKRFSDILMNIGEPDTKPTPFPVKELKQL